MRITNHTCNTCTNSRTCTLASANDYPNLLSKPKRECDVIGMCDKWAPIISTVPMGAVVRGAYGNK